jgi:hypothetical protein
LVVALGKQERICSVAQPRYDAPDASGAADLRDR